MLDVAALPIAFALTLWDAAPIFPSISVALALVSRVVLRSSTFTEVWRARDAIAIEGVVYALLFHPALAPVIAVASGALVVFTLRSAAASTPAPATPGRVLRNRAEEALWSILIASGVAAIVKIAAPDLPDNDALYYVLAVIAGGVVGFRGGAVAIPAVAVATHLGGIGPAALCVLAAGISQAVATHRASQPAVQSAEST